MPIRFRCTYCNRLLGIATRKAGTQTRCPHCGYEITVPMPQEDDARTQRLDLDDVAQMLDKSGAATATESAVAAPPAPPHAPVSPPSPAALDLPDDEQEASATTPPAVPKRAALAAPKVPAKPPKPANPANPDDPPLFEGDMDEILGKTAPPEEPERPKRAPTSGADADALSLAEPPRTIVLTGTTATLLMVLVVLLLILAFAAGYLLAPRS